MLSEPKYECSFCGKEHPIMIIQDVFDSDIYWLGVICPFTGKYDYLSSKIYSYEDALIEIESIDLFLARWKNTEKEDL